MKLKKLFLGAIVFFLYGINSHAQLNITFQAQLTYPGETCANVSGYVDSLGNEYALVGASGGLSIVDVTVPSMPVEIFQHTGPTGGSALWQEIKVRGKYAYLVTEAGGGLQIFNLSSLPDTSGILFQSWTGDGAIAGMLNSSHALHIDNNYLYLFGGLYSGGAVAIDITDPWNPTYVGNYQNISSVYVHDGFVRNDTLYSAHLYGGFFSVVDFTNKSAPVEIANQSTPNGATHNTWLSTNGKTLFTTDETYNSYLTAYDISNLTSINELDRIQTNPGSNSSIHNTHIINVGGNDYAVSSWYTDGISIVDVGRPQNLIQVANYDTYPMLCYGSLGAWGVYPYLSSGNILVTNIHEGLFVLTPSFVRACYLEGNITNFSTGLPISNVEVEILTTNGKTVSTISGDYKTGIPSPGGIYSIKFSKPGYNSTTISGISLSSGAITSLNSALVLASSFTFSGQVIDISTSLPIANAKILMQNKDSIFQTTTDASGNYSFTSVYDNVYDIYISKWGYELSCLQSQTINSGTGLLITQLIKGYYDDFTLDLGWLINSTATSGLWKRGEPEGIYGGLSCDGMHPETDDLSDCYNLAYVTGSTDNDLSTFDEVNGGNTILESPVFDLTTYFNPYINYSRWFFNNYGTGIPNDSLNIFINNGITSVLIDSVYSLGTANAWTPLSIKITDYITPSATMKLIVRTADNAPSHYVEAGFDKFFVSEGPTGVEDDMVENTSNIRVYPNPFSNSLIIEYELKNKISNNASIIFNDITGKEVGKYSIEQSKGSVQIQSELNAGIYFVRTINGSEITKPTKVIKIE